MERKGKIKYAINCTRKACGTWQKIGRAHTSLRLYNSAECILIISLSQTDVSDIRASVARARFIAQTVSFFLTLL